MGNKSKKKVRARQLTMPFVRVARPGKKLGRKPRPESGVHHVRRPDVSERHPMLITIKLEQGLPNLRRREEFAVVMRALAFANRVAGFRVVQFAVLPDHLHLLCEAGFSEEPSGSAGDSVRSALQGFGVRLARGLNKLWGRKGSVFADRYHRVDKRTPREVRHAIRYVLMNARKHGVRVPAFRAKGRDGVARVETRVDPYSSARWFDGWSEGRISAGTTTAVRAPRTWLLRVGWQRGEGRLFVEDAPTPAGA